MMKNLIKPLFFAGLALAYAAPSSALDAAAAEKLMRKSKCMTCHAIDKKKDGPPLQEIAKKWKGKPDTMVKLTKHVTTPGKVKIDGKEEDHENLKTDDPAEVKNVLEWILSQ